MHELTRVDLVHQPRPFPPQTPDTFFFFLTSFLNSYIEGSLCACALIHRENPLGKTSFQMQLKEHFCEIFSISHFRGLPLPALSRSSFVIQPAQRNSILSAIEQYYWMRWKISKSKLSLHSVLSSFYERLVGTETPREHQTHISQTTLFPGHTVSEENV